MENNLKKVTGLWIKKDKNGNMTFSFKIGDKRYVAFKNKFKLDGSSSPDLVLYEDVKAPEGA